jgi:hypothetical protein
MIVAIYVHSNDIYIKSFLLIKIQVLMHQNEISFKPVKDYLIRKVSLSQHLLVICGLG